MFIVSQKFDCFFKNLGTYNGHALEMNLIKIITKFLVLHLHRLSLVQTQGMMKTKAVVVVTMIYQ